MKFYQFLIEIDAFDGATVETLLICGKPQFGPEWIPAIKDPGLIRSEMFSNNKTFGKSTYSYGEIILNNIPNHAIGETGGPLDYLRDYNFDGRAIRVYQGDMGYSREDFDLIISATIESVSFNWEEISFTLRSPQVEFDIPLNGGTFLGNNALPLGVEGSEGDLKGKPKPVLLGRVYNASPVLCNTSKLIYAVSPATGIACTSVGAEFHVYDKGVLLNYGGTYTDQIDMETNAPLPGHYMVWELGGYFRLGSTPAGNITFDGASYGRSVTAKTSNLIRDALSINGLSGMVEDVSFESLAQAAPFESGIYITNNENLSDVIDRLCSAAGAFWYFDVNRKVVLGQFVDPSTMLPDFSLSTNSIIEKFKREKIKDTPGGMPVHTLRFYHSQNYTIQTDPAESVSQSRRAWLKEKWLTETVTDESIKISHPLSGELDIETSLASPDLQEAIRRFNLYSVDRDLVTLDGILLETFGSVRTLHPGLCFQLDLNGRFGYSPKNMILIGFTVNHVSETVSLSLWG